MVDTLRFCLISSIVMVGCIAIHISGGDVKYVRVKTENGTLRFSCASTVLKEFATFKDILDDKDIEVEEIPLDYDERHITPYTVGVLLLQAGDLTKDRFCSMSFQNSMGLIKLAENLGACDALKDKVAQIPYYDHIYDALSRAAFSTKNTQKSEFEREAARQWLVRCIPHASDKKKIELRNILYPLQYTSAVFTALKNKVSEILAIQNWQDRAAFHELQEFKEWQNSFEHKAYCAAKPSTALSCAEFHSEKQKNRVTLEPGQSPDEYGIYRGCDNRGKWKGVSFACTSCGGKKSVSSWFKPNDIEILACNACLEKSLSGKVVDLSDCYNLDKISLYRIMNHAHYGGGDWNYCDKKMSEDREYIKHLSQIHLPLLKLLLDYKHIGCYARGDGGYCVNTQLTFGTSTLELYPIDMKALASFWHDSSDDPCHLSHTVTCIFNIKTKNDVIPLKSELTKLRKGSGFMIRFQAPDADLTHEKWNGRYPAVFRDDKWFTTDLPGAIDFAIKAIGVLVIWHFISKTYNQRWHNYITQLNNCADTIPNDVKAIAGYLSANQKSGKQQCIGESFLF